MKRFVILISLSVLCIASTAWAQQLPSVVLKDMRGRSVDTSKLSNNGNPIVLSFFATWCHPCIRELNAISDEYDEWQEDTGVKVILVSIDDAQNSQKVRPLVEGQAWDFDVLLDPDGELKRLMQVQNVPHTFLIDGNGNIVYSHLGYTDGSENELYRKVKSCSNKK